jgi:hypothetical protein
MRSRITKRAQHTGTHAHRITGLRRAAANLSGAYVAPGVFEARAPASRDATDARDARRSQGVAGSGATLWTLPTSAMSATGVPTPALASPSAGAARSSRRRSSVSAVPVDWSAVRGAQSV